MIAEYILLFQFLAAIYICSRYLDLINIIKTSYSCISVINLPENEESCKKKIFKQLWKTFLFFFFFYSSLKQKINDIFKKNTEFFVEEIARNTYSLTYTIKDNKYKTIVKLRRGPSDILGISDQNSNEITDKILPYVGPQGNWSHSVKFTPDILGGYDSLEINYSDGTTKKFDKFDEMV